MMGDVYDHLTQLKISEEFSRLGGECYLDHAGASLYSEKQIANIASDLCSKVYGNPHSLSQGSKHTTDLVDQVRYRLLSHFHTTPKEYSVIFTSGATAAIKLLFESFDWRGPEEDNKEEEYSDVLCNHYGPCNSNENSSVYVYTQTNHTSVVGARELAGQHGVQSYCMADDIAFKILRQPATESRCRFAGNSIFAYPAQCNFSGRKYPLKWLETVRNGALDAYPSLNQRRNSKWFSLLDAATYCSTNDLDLSKARPDFVCLSFYKIFGYPTGLGALLVRNSSSSVLRKTYFGGGTVDISLPTRRYHKLRSNLERFEDGTLPFLSVISLNHGFSTFARLNISMVQTSAHVFHLAQYTVQQLKSLKHWNQIPLIEIYADTNYEDMNNQGGIVNFNVKRSNLDYIGFTEVLHMANLHNIHFRTGCFCNTGACQKHLGLTEKDLLRHYQAGHVCGDNKDLVEGRPTGSVRVSFGYMNTLTDVDKLINMLKGSFLEISNQLPINSSSIRTKKGDIIVLKRMYVFPVKSCGAMEVYEWRLDSRGLEYDRQWMVVAGDGTCLTQKQDPRLCLIQPCIDRRLQTLTLTYRTNGARIKIPLETLQSETVQHTTCDSKVCGDRVQGVDCGDEVAEWLDSQLNRKGLRLVKQEDKDGRTSKISQYRGTTAQDKEMLSLSNQAQYLLINQTSVDWLTTKMEQGDIPLANFADRFRGNFIVDGALEMAELEWNKITIGDISFRVEGPCTRCQMICIDQQTAEKNRKPLAALSRALSGKLKFGVYLTNLAGLGTLKVNDFVQIEK